jgi:tRNA (mo5U34)-methyltransferase
MHTLPENRLNTPQAQNWAKLLETAPTILTKKIILTQDIIDIGNDTEIDPIQKETIISIFKALTPWRKGPYRIFGTLIDSEWQCQLKWNRLAPHLPDLTDKTALDIGCNSGYFSFRLAGLNAKKVIAIDPTTLYFFQFHLLNRYINTTQIDYLPIGFEDLGPTTPEFDVILNMGILYHHPNPIDCLMICRNKLKKNGLLILETLIISDPAITSLIPKDRYAGMKNVYQIPSVPQIMEWLSYCGFNSAEVIDTTITTISEQRSTPWSSPHSLKNVITDTGITIEGYPQPRRVMIKAWA